MTLTEFPSPRIAEDAKNDAAFKAMLADPQHPCWALAESLERQLCARHQHENPTSVPCRACSKDAMEWVCVPVAALLLARRDRPTPPRGERPMTLTDFLLARIAEDEAVARATIDELAFLGPPRTRGRAIADCEAKKRIVERLARHSQSGTSRECRRCDTLRDLASVYADHPDYRAEWKP